MTDNTDHYQFDTELRPQSLSFGSGDTLGFDTSEQYVEVLDEFVEMSPYPSRSAAMRSLIWIGMHAYANELNYQHSEPEADEETESTENPIRTLIPEGKQNSVHLFNELPEIIEEELIDMVEEDPEINRDGMQVFK